MRKVLFVIACVAGLGLLVALIVQARRRQPRVPEWPADAEWDAPVGREPAEERFDFSMAVSTAEDEQPAAEDTVPAEAEPVAEVEPVAVEEPTEAEPVAEVEPVAEAEPGADADAHRAEPEAAPVAVTDAAEEPDRLEGNGSASPEFVALIGGADAIFDRWSEHLRRELRAELEKLPRQPLFERANACGVPTSRTILMSREELIAAIEDMELRDRVANQ